MSLGLGLLATQNSQCEDVTFLLREIAVGIFTDQVI